MLQLNEVTFSYDGTRPIMTNANIDIVRSILSAPWLAQVTPNTATRFEGGHHRTERALQLFPIQRIHSHAVAQGAGKSTLLKLLIGELEASSGVVTRNGRLRIACGSSAGLSLSLLAHTARRLRSTPSRCARPRHDARLLPRLSLPWPNRDVRPSLAC